MRQVVALCVLALAATGCGGAARDSAKSFKGEQQKVATVVEQLEKAARTDKPGTVCTTLLSDSLLATLKKLGTTCTTGVKDAFADADSLDLTVQDVAISAESATAKVVSGSGSKEKTDTLEFERAGTTWKISSLRAAS